MGALEKTWQWREWTFFQIYPQWCSASSLLKVSCVLVSSLLMGHMHFNHACPCYWFSLKKPIFFSPSPFSWEAFLRNLLSIQRQTRQHFKWSSRRKKLVLEEAENGGGIRKKERSSLLKLCGKVKRSSNIEIFRLSSENCIRKDTKCRNAGSVRERG